MASSFSHRGLPLAAACALLTALSDCRIERTDRDKRPHGPALSSSTAAPLAWSRDVALVAVVSPAAAEPALGGLRELAHALCEELTLQGNAEAEWHATLVETERALNAERYRVREVLLATSDGRWGAAVAASPERSPAPIRAPPSAAAGPEPLIPLAWQLWEQGAGLMLTAQDRGDDGTLAGRRQAQRDMGSSDDLSSDWVRRRDATTQAGADDLASDWVRATERPRDVRPAAAARARKAHGAQPAQPAPAQPPRAARASDDDDAGIAPAEREATQRSPRPARVRVALLVRSSDGSFRGAWFGAFASDAPAPQVLRDAVVGERLFVAAHGAVVALAAPKETLDPSAASRAYERLLQPGTGTPPDVIALTASTLEPSELPGVLTLSSRGALPGRCRLVNQEQMP